MSLFILTSLYHPRRASSIAMSSSTVTPAQSHPQENSTFSLPKKPSHLALSGLHPFLDMDLTRPFSSHILTYPGQR